MKLATKLIIILIISTLLLAGVLSYTTFILLGQSATSSHVPVVINSILIAATIILLTNSMLLIIIVKIFHTTNSITKAIKELTLGNLDKRITLNSKDELGDMANTFNNMANKLQELYANLQKKVEEKTAELNQTLRDTERYNKLTLGRELKLMEYKKELARLSGKPNLISTESIAAKISEEQITKTAMLNIMEDLQIERELAYKQKKILDSIISNMPIGVAINDVTGKMILINEVGSDMLGRGLNPNTKLTEAREIHKVCKADGSPYPVEELTTSITIKEGIMSTKDDLVIVRPDGKKVMIRATSAPIKDLQGKMVSVVTIFEDITKEKDVDRMKTEFISLASHQLRTPLSAIKWFSEMLVEGDAGELTSEQKDFAKNISESTQRMIELVNSLLNISRIESGRIMIDPKPTDLRDLINGIVKELEVKTKHKQQTLVVSVHHDLKVVNIDPKLVRQVYMNLLTNAIKYTQPGGEISIFVSRKDDDIISQVTDNGYGIPKLEHAKIFQKFFRAENIIKVETDGTGLGLYLIKAIIESSHGRIWFESEEGKGTTFWFSLPASGMEAKKGEVTLDA